jgi:hypothetical protein
MDHRRRSGGSAVWALTCAIGLAAAWPALDRMQRVGLGTGALMGLGTMIAPLLGHTPGSDGAILRVQLRSGRFLRRMEAQIGRPLTDAEVRHMIATASLPEAVERELDAAPAFGLYG